MKTKDWDYWIGKKIFVRLRNGNFFSGKVIEIDDSLTPIIWIIIIDKFGKKVMFVHSEILEIREERE